MSDFITGQSDPDDFTVAEVVDHLEASDADEVTRVQSMEAAGQDRVTIARWEREPDPEPEPAPSDEDAPEPYTAESRPEVGETLPDEGDGYTRVVVSV